MLSNVPVGAFSQRHPTTALTRYTTPNRRMSSPSFGSRVALVNMTDMAMKNVLEPVFRLTQDYIWELMMLDVVAIWVPRIANALNRGRYKVSMNEITADPKHKNKPSMGQFGVWAQKNLKGFNWPNGVEETWREVQSAPMVLFVQSVLFGLLMHYDPVKTGLLLPKGDIETLNRSFSQWMVAHPNRAKNMLTARRGMRESMQHFYEHLLKGHFENKPIDLKFITENVAPMGADRIKLAHPKQSARVSTGQQKTIEWMEQHFGKSIYQKPPTYHQLVNQWSHDLSRAVSEGKPHSVIADLESVLQRLTQEFNESVLHQRPTMPLDKLLLKGQAHAAKTAGQTVDMFQKYYDYARALRTSVRREGVSVAKTPEMLQQLSRKLFQLERQVIPRKMLYSFGVMALTMVVYFASSLHAQSNNRYPANRLYGEPVPFKNTGGQNETRGNSLRLRLNRGAEKA